MRMEVRLSFPFLSFIKTRQSYDVQLRMSIENIT